MSASVLGLMQWDPGADQRLKDKVIYHVLVNFVLRLLSFSPEFTWKAGNVFSLSDDPGRTYRGYWDSGELGVDICHTRESLTLSYPSRAPKPYF
jgi:hypothetical protein